MPSGRTRYARRAGLRIAYEIHRARWRRLPWLVLIQGLGFDRSGWAPVTGPLGERFSLLLVDNRGSGRSDPPADRVSVADLAGDVVAVLDHAGLAKAHVAGTSLGGMIAQELAITAPDRVDTLVLSGTTPGWPFAYPMPTATATLLASSSRLDPGEALRRNVENALAPDTVRHRPDLVEEIVAVQRRRGADPGWTALMQAGARFGNLRQPAITARTLIVHGTADRVVDPRNARLLAERIPRSRLLLLPHLGHLLHWEAPQHFAGAVIQHALAPVAPVLTRPVSQRKDPS